ncbi:protein NRT1/ PTR FAMILY 2.7-like isoform X3 [Diospyros lotus]|uniref:protein NRT1/ PTR FAMILY 2.7-like isoform X2 n=2 Tax=Diospyros lotus TaxID=55363 RepID=UPI002254688C|nr:protein NRT1/ PTR FAMILY 2.7-like isoform X2 [Diospyros lotus]XP_052171051.1 protein NRT1/ PTR FAMILY 2.7-like isoform X3 [Diospyros lotus]
MEDSVPAAGEHQLSFSGKKPGGWITFPFITATMACLTLAAGGWINNLLVYMNAEFNVPSIDSAQIWNVVNGCTTMFPVVGAIIADSYLGCFSVIWISSLISLLGIVLLMLTATVDSLRPLPCESSTNSCAAPSKAQYAVLYTALALAIVGVSGTRYTIGTMGADQFDQPKHHGTFWNWFIFTLYTSSAISSTLIVYVEDNVSWGLGFGLCAVANVVGLAVFVLGRRFYRHVKPQGSPFLGLARVVVAAVRKRKVAPAVEISEESEDYYYYQKPESGATKAVAATPTKAFRFLNRAAVKTEGDTNPDGSVAKPWKLCTVQQVEDLKTLIRIFPLWSSGIFLCLPLAAQTSLAILQALSMDRRVVGHFKLPAGSMIVFILLSTSISIAIIDRFLSPFWNKLTRRPLTPLQRVGTGQVITFLSMVVSAVVEAKRLKEVRSHDLQGQTGAIVPLSVLWLVPQLALAGISEGFHFPGNVAFYYQEFPASLKSTSTAMVTLFVGIAFYLSSAVVGIVRKTTGWLPDNVNDGRMDNVYWVFSLVCGLNFGYYVVCAWLYKYQVVGDEDHLGEEDDRL